MFRPIHNFLARLVALLLFSGIAWAQNAPPPMFTQQELDRMLAPVALYPDALLTQLLMASTYPDEVSRANKWLKNHPGLSGEQAVRAVENRKWDPSVKSMVAFPQVLETMASSREWTENLGDAFLGQEGQVWDTVQKLRDRAYAAGNLRSNEQYVVQRQGPVYVIESPRPEVIFVPYYDPLVVYGNWWWPGYAPVRWSPWAGYAVRPGYGAGYYWGGGVNIGVGFFFGGVDWRQRQVTVVNVNNFYYRRSNPAPLPPGNVWRHNPEHRGPIPYRNPAVAQQFAQVPGAGRPQPGQPSAVRPNQRPAPETSRPAPGTSAPGTPAAPQTDKPNRRPRPDASTSTPAAQPATPGGTATAPANTPAAQGERPNRRQRPDAGAQPVTPGAAQPAPAGPRPAATQPSARPAPSAEQSQPKARPAAEADRAPKEPRKREDKN